MRSLFVLVSAIACMTVFEFVSSASAAGLMMTSFYHPASAGIAASRRLPFGTRLRLTNPRNGRSVIVTIRDRGPFVRGRSLDISRAYAERLGFIGAGVARLEATPLK
jgi:rare lipoprotein A